jgi:hypothetical protein
MVTKKRTTTKEPAASRAPKSAAAAALQARIVPEELIRERAYCLSLERQGGSADPMADRIRAEQELAVDLGARSRTRRRGIRRGDSMSI